VGWGAKVTPTPGYIGGLTLSGALAARPPAASLNRGWLYLATDISGGTLYRSDGATWTQVAASVTGGGGASATTVEVDLGSVAIFRGKFTITDAAITAAKKVLCWQAPGPYTGKGTLADEAEMQPVSVIAVEPLSGTATVRWQTPPMITTTGFKNNTGAASPQEQARRIGVVRGNVKFTYMVLA